MRCQRLYELKMGLFKRDSKKVVLRQARYIDTKPDYIVELMKLVQDHPQGGVNVVILLLILTN